MNQRILVFSILLASSLSLWSEPAAARRTIFNPHLYLEASYSDNVTFTRTPQDDVFFRFAAVFPVSHELRRDSLLTASYTLFFDRFKEFDQFDSESHRFSLGLLTRPSERSALVFSSYYETTEDQALLADPEEFGLFLTPRLKRDILDVDLGYRQDLPGRWAIGGNVGYTEIDFDTILGVQDRRALLAVQSRSGFRASVSLSREFSTRMTGGIRYGWRDFDLDPIPGDPSSMMGEETTHFLSLFVRRTLTQLWRFDANAGVFRRTGQGSDGSDLFREGFFGGLAFTRTLRRIEVELFGRYSPTSEGPLRGTSTDTIVGVSVNDITPGRWTWQAYARYGIRDPAERTRDEVESLGAGGYVEWGLQRLLSLRFSASWVDQTSDDILDDRSFYRVSLALIYYPLGRRKLAGGPGRPIETEFE